MPVIPRRTLVLLFAAVLCGHGLARAEDGYDLWLRYRPVESQWIAPYRAAANQVSGPAGSATLQAAQSELTRALKGMLGVAPAVSDRITHDGAILLGTSRSSASIARLRLNLGGIGTDGYLLRSVSVAGHHVIVIAANDDLGVLYGVFQFLRLLQTRQSLEHLDMKSSPHIQLRVLDHWDNLDGSIERGYAGASIWDWQKLPDYLDPRYTVYARACASVGINGTVLNNVNANAASLTALYLRKTAALAAVFRPYGLHVFLSARFSASIEIGGLGTADPLDPAVRAWWRAKADEIYQLIPDFGGFLVKANSEGQPGPQDYGRSHADGANMLAEALAPHGGVVMWRAFVYSQQQTDDRAKQAYTEFTPLDGSFRDNVLLQVKNGPIDFQPREPFHPLFGAMPGTPLAMEVEITKEYLGFNTHLVFLGTMWEEVLRSDTYARGPGSTVARVVEGRLDRHALSAIAGVSNIGNDRNWCGSQFDQANWYAFGRLAWDPELSAKSIAEDWVGMTFGNDPRLVAAVTAMMIGSRQAAVDYMTPLGLHHLMGTGAHYGPAPWVHDLKQPEWNPVYYHRADAAGIGFDRTASGSDAVAQYAPPATRRFADLRNFGNDYLLWFHHVPWGYQMGSGRTLWDELVFRYSRGVATVGQMGATWDRLAPLVDAQRHFETASFLAIQEREAR